VCSSDLMAWGWSFFAENYGEAIDYIPSNRIAFVNDFGFLQNLPVFVCGVITYRLFFDYFIKMEIEARRRCGLLFVISFLFLYAALLTEHLQNIHWGKNILHGICFSLLILGLGLRPFNFLVNVKTVYMGKISYSLYLIHPLLVLPLIPVYYWFYGLLPGNTLGFSASLLITLGLLTVISLISYKYIERKGVALGEKLINNV
jgi:peptidoglycan/LPS O-acetylase OafA/YrhL